VASALSELKLGRTLGETKTQVPGSVCAATDFATSGRSRFETTREAWTDSVLPKDMPSAVLKTDSQTAVTDRGRAIAFGRRPESAR
jgi:hypothetical protein